MSKLMKPILPLPYINPPREDKIANRVAWRNPNTYSRSNDPVEVEEWIREMEEIFTIIEVPKDEKVNIGHFI